MITNITVGGFSGHQIRLRRESFAAERVRPAGFVLCESILLVVFVCLG